MTIRKTSTLLGVLAALAVIAVAGILTHDTWRGWFLAVQPGGQTAEEAHAHGQAGQERVRLSPQARANMGLLVKPLKLESYARTIMIPGMVVERPGRSDRNVTAPFAGILKRVEALPGDIVRPGDELVVVRLNSEYLQNSQTELYKASRELEINQAEIQRLEIVAKEGALPQSKMIELEYQRRRLSVTLQALNFDLAARGLTDDQIEQAAKGRFVTEITIRVPSKERMGSLVAKAKKEPGPGTPAPKDGPAYELEDLKVQPGEQVQAGQVVCTLANHEALYIEGRVFKHETPLIEKTAQQSWPVRAEFAEETMHHWPPRSDQLKIRFLANRVDPASQTVPFYAPLANQYREYTETGKTFRIWRFRPGQRVRLYVTVEQFPEVVVLPAEAVVREGPEAYVFRANGDLLERKPVRVLYEDRQNVVLANDGSVNVGNYLAHNGAAQLNRVLKASAAGGEGHGHDDHGH